VTIDDANYEGATSGTLLIAKADQTISFDSLAPDDAKYHGSYTPSATATSDLPVTLAASGTCSLDETSGAVTMTGVGECTVTANQAGNANYNAAQQAIQRFDVNKATASITLNGLAVTYDGSAKTVTAVTTPASLDVTITYDGSATAPSAAGEYAVEVTIDDANYEGATSGTLVIAKAGQTISFPTIASKKFGDAPFTVSATSDSGLTVSITATGACSISGATVTISGAGTCTVTASQTGDSNYKAAAEAVQNVTVDKATWTVKGFYQPLDGNGVVNTAKGGSTIPVKFEVFQGDTEITDPSKVKILVQSTTCATGAATDEVEEIVAGTSGLRYDPTSGQFIYTWKAPKSTGTCYKLSVAATGTNEEIPGTPSALVKLK
jgi:hypothetical protein